MHRVTCYVLLTAERMNEMMTSEPLGSSRNGSSRNGIYCLFYANSSQTLSINGLPLGEEWHAEHLIHS